MSANLDDARRAYEAAKRIMEQHSGLDGFKDDARLLLTNHEAEYRAALIDAAERRFDALGIKVGETECEADGMPQFVIMNLKANVDAGRVIAVADCGGWVWVDELRPYTAPEARGMVLESHSGDTFVDPKRLNLPHFRLTLTNVTPADLDAMTGPITGTYTIERLK